MAELASREVLKARHVAPMPEVTPLELAHLVAAMGLGEQADGPAKALSLLSRSAAYIDGMKIHFENLNDSLATEKSDKSRILAELGLSKEAADRTFSVDEVIAKLPTEPLKVSGKELRGRNLWIEFRRQVDPQPGRPGKTAEEDQPAPEEYSLADLIRVFRQFMKWRDTIATANKAKGSKNLDKTNRERRENAKTDGADAVDAVRLPKVRQ